MPFSARKCGETIWGELRMVMRERPGREASINVAVFDNQSLKLAENGLRQK